MMNVPGDRSLIAQYCKQYCGTEQWLGINLLQAAGDIVHSEQWQDFHMHGGHSPTLQAKRYSLQLRNGFVLAQPLVRATEFQQIPS